MAAPASLFNAKLLAGLTFRRRCSTAAAAAAAAAAAKGREWLLAADQYMVKRPAAAAATTAEDDDEASRFWVPDPATGYYRPANRMGEIDPAELREMLLGRSSNKNK